MSHGLILPHEHDKIALVDAIEAEHPSAQVLEKHALSHPLALDHLAQISAGLTTPITADCSKAFYPALRSSGTRPLSVILWIVEHAEEARTAVSAASWFRNPDCRGSAHLCVDANICYRCLPNEAICWGAPGANYRGFHNEQAMYTADPASAWEARPDLLKRSAFKTAWHLRLFHLPCQFVDHVGLSKNVPGVTTHLECTRAFGGDHTDPGAGWPRVHYMKLVKGYFDHL